VKKRWDSELDIICPTCRGKGFIISSNFVELQNQIDEMLDIFPYPNIHGTGQWFFNSQTILKLIITMLIRGDLENKRVLCLTTPSLAGGIALSNFAESVYALDIDNYLLAKIKSFVLDNNASIETIKYNVENAIDSDLYGKFNCFIVDPLYAIDHYKIVLSRAVQFLGSKPNKIGYIVIPPEGIAMVKNGKEEKSLSLKVIEIINKMNFAIIDFKPKFIEYSLSPAESYIFSRRFKELRFLPGTPSEWRVSDLLIVKTTVNTKPLYKKYKELKTPIFSSERCGINSNLSPIKTKHFTKTLCKVCRKCYRGFYKLRKEKESLIYYPLDIDIIPLSSWRPKGDKLIMIDNLCHGYVNNKNGIIIVFKGPASKEVWKIIEDKFKIKSSRPINKSSFIEGLIDQLLFSYTDNSDQIHTELPTFFNRLLDNDILNKDDFE